MIEVDGGQHYDAAQIAKDAARTHYLESRGMKVMRFTNIEVLQETEAVLNRIWEEVE